MLLALILAAAVPKGPVEADLVTFIPRLDAIGTVMPFFEAAGTRSLMLRPDSWREQAYPLLEVDVTSRESLEAAGIDPTGSLSLSRLGDRTITCVTLAKPEVHAKRVEEKLALKGKLFTKKEAGVTVVASRDAIDRVLAAVATQGKEACSIVANGLSVEKQLPILVRTLTRGALTQPLVPGVVSVLVPQAPKPQLKPDEYVIHDSIFESASLTAKDLTLTVDVKTNGRALPTLAGPGASPYANFAPAGMFSLRARFTKSAMNGLVSQFIHRVPLTADLSKSGASLAPLLTGNAAVVLSHVKVTTGLRTPQARFFAVRFAVLAETNDPAAAQAVVDALDPKMLAVKEGSLSVAVSGSTVIISNDDEAKKAALAALASAGGKQSHAIEFIGFPVLVANALAQVPLLEAVQTPELAALLGVSTELGPLLLASESAVGWVEPAGTSSRAQLTWKLDAAKVRADAGH